MKLNEYNEGPKWYDSLTKEQQYDWYVHIKETLPMWRQTMGDVSQLEHAIKDYEVRNNIV